MKTLTLMILASLSFGVFADDHERAPMSTDGAFITLQVASPDIEKYRQTLIDNPSAFQATGATAAGICVTNSGHEYLGQMMVWSAFPNVAAALSGSTMTFPKVEEFMNLFRLDILPDRSVFNPTNTGSSGERGYIKVCLPGKRYHITSLSYNCATD